MLFLLPGAKRSKSSISRTQTNTYSATLGEPSQIYLTQTLPRTHNPSLSGYSPAMTTRIYNLPDVRVLHSNASAHADFPSGPSAPPTAKACPSKAQRRSSTQANRTNPRQSRDHYPILGYRDTYNEVRGMIDLSYCRLRDLIPQAFCKS